MMDPVTAFSLAAGVLQVLDLSLQALGKCREIHKDGSLAQHRQTEEITKSLADTSERLRSSAHFAPTAASKESKDVIDLSQRCSATAEELLSELRKLQLDPRDGFFKAAKISVGAFRRKKFLAETEDKLQKYQTILNTRILSKLDVHAIQQIEKSRQIDQHVKELAKGLAEGRNIVKQLLSDQTGIIKGHIDHQFENQAQREAKQRLRREFKENLFFPEIFARRDDIPRSHEGTCRWILKPLEQRIRLDNNQESNIAGKRVPPESNFVEWLKRGEEIYWLNGKPGAGKSTLMKYISTEVPEIHRSGQALSKSGTEDDLMACSFFFWSLGVPLQKNYVGFVRSLLYQIAEQRDDAISIMMGKNALSTKDGGRDNFDDFAPAYMWTIERLDDALKRFLDKKPESLRFYVFLDGLDEFEGDEDPLLHTIRLLAQTPGTRVCVSSRPEQIFRQGFANSPQLRLQDFNSYDIERASRDQLESALTRHFPDSLQEIQELIQDVARISSGIFLWAALMNKIIKRGMIKGDTLQELLERLNHTPDTIDGLYQDMLSRLDKEYLRDAARYMHMLLINQEVYFFSYQDRLTLLHFACLEQSTQDHKMSDDATYYQSKEFDELCRKLEKRILARCGGLVEIIEQDSNHDFSEYKAIDMFGVHVGQRENGDLDCKIARGSITRNNSPVVFIHKTAADFIRKYEIFVKDPKWPLKATLNVTRGRIEALALVSLMLDKTGLEDVDIQINKDFLVKVMTALPRLEAKWPFEEDHQSIRNMAFDTINRTFDLADYVYTSLNVTKTTFSSQPKNIEYCNKNRTSSFFDSRLGCAAYHGCADYVRRCVMPSTCSEGLAEEILDSALKGFYSTYWIFGGIYEVNPMYIGLLKIILDFVPRSRSGFWNDSKCDEGGQPRWLTFTIKSLASVLPHFIIRDQGFHRALPNSSQFLTTWKLVLKSILDHNVDPNYLLQVRWFCDRKTRQQEDVEIILRTSETLLSSLKRDLVHSEFTEDIVRLLETYGAVDRRDEVLIGTRNSSTREIQLFRLTQFQREKLMQLPFERLFYTLFDKANALRYFVELPVVDQPSPRAEELLELLCQEVEQPGSVFQPRLQRPYSE